MLLEKASALRDSADHYRWILPAELAGLELSEDAAGEISSALRAEVLRNPDEAFIAVLACGGDEASIQAVSRVLVNPPRALTMTEYGAALTFVKANLPYCLTQDPNFLSREDVETLLRLAAELKKVDVEEATTDRDRSARVRVRIYAADLIKGLAPFRPSDSSIGFVSRPEPA
jgi:hypothetical protein